MPITLAISGPTVCGGRGFAVRGRGWSSGKRRRHDTLRERNGAGRRGPASGASEGVRGKRREAPIFPRKIKVPPQRTVSRILFPSTRPGLSAEARRRATIIPLAPSLLTGSSGLPGSLGRVVRWAPVARRPALPYLALLRAGFCLPRLLPGARCALTAPFHPCLFAPAEAGAPVSGVFSVPLSFELPRPGVTRRTALWSSDFPPPPARRRSSGLLRRLSN